MVVDFAQDPPTLKDSVVTDAVTDVDMSINSFVNRMIETFNRRNIWLDDLFI